MTEFSDPPAIARHVAMIHTLARQADVRGKLVLAVFGGRAPAVHHFAIGDIVGMTRRVLAYASEPGANVYMPLVVVGPDLPDGLKGGEDDVIAVLGFVVDADADKGKEAPRPPLPADYMLETSEGNAQHFLLLDRALSREEAKALAEALKAATEADGAGDISHVWRLPGCLNWPNKAKLERGRSPAPQAVRVIKQWDGSRTSVDDLRSRLADHWQAPASEPRTPNQKYDVDPDKAKAFLIKLRDASYFDLGPNYRERYVWATKACAYDLGDDPGRDIWERVVCWQGVRENEGIPADAEEMETRWRDCSNLKPGKRPVTFGTLIRDAEKVYGWTGINLRRDKSAAQMFPPHKVAALAATPPEPAAVVHTAQQPGSVSLISGGATTHAPEYGETEIAERFADRHATELRFVKTWNAWLHWTGRRWHRDDSDFVTDLARKHCREESALCSRTPGYTAAQARAICTDRTVNAVMRLARVDRRIASTAETWDQDHWLLGTPGGVIELRTGELRPARPEDHVTKSTAVAPGGDCPRWLAFLARATGGDAELQAYLQRLCGYALTGSTREHSLHFVFGPGGAGKGTFVHALESILGDYHVGTPIQTFTESKYDRHPAEIAALHGARLVTCSETEKGRHWAEARIKELTGGDTISARFMNQNFFNFAPTFKILISGNYKPHMRPDAAMRRRFQLAPFTTSIPDHEKDRTLGDKLRAEWPGILAWAIQGCLAWQKHGLNPPPAILDATEEYFEEEAEDVLTMWLHDRCDVDPQAETPHGVLYDSFKRYAEHAGERAISSKQFAKDLRVQKFESDRTGKVRLVVGLKLRVDAVTAQPHGLPPFTNHVT